MASVVDTSIKHFHSGMSGMPPVNGLNGSIVALLDALLKDGIDLKTAASLTVAGGVATLAFSGSHSAREDTVVQVAGSSIGALNGEQKVTAVAPGVVKFATAAADGVASGTITFKMAPLGWDKPFSGANKAVYRSLDPMGTRMFFRLADASGSMARVVGYEAMTDVDVGAGAFPSAAQMPGGGYWVKSSIANATAVPWFLVGDARGFYLWVAPFVASDPVFTSGWVRGFGDMAVLRPGGDPFACGLNLGIYGDVGSGWDGVLGGSGSTNQARTAFPRSYSGLGSSVWNYCAPYTGSSNTVSGADATLGPCPSKIDGQLKFSNLYMTESPEPRANVPGLRHVPQSRAFAMFKHLDAVPGTGEMAGRKLVCLQIASGGIGSAPDITNTGTLFVDVTGPWPR